MHDIAYIRANPQAFDAALARRGADPVADRIIALDAKKREASTKVQQAQSRRNDASKAIGQAMGQGDKDKAEALKAEVAEIKASMPQWEDAASAAPDIHGYRRRGSHQTPMRLSRLRCILCRRRRGRRSLQSRCPARSTAFQVC